MFRLEDGAILRNVVLGAPAADGIHCYGDVVLENIVWEDVGEDAMTIKDEGTVELRGGSATLADDKVFQMDEAIFRADSPVSTVTMTNTRYSNIGDELFMGVSQQNITTSGNVAY